MNSPAAVSTPAQPPAASGVLDKTRLDLEWPRLVAAVGARCRGPLASRIELPVARTREGAVAALAETGEVLALLRSGETLPLDGIRELRTLLKRVARDGALTAPELRDVMRTLEAARALRRFLSARREMLGALQAACPLDPTLDRLHDELAAAIEPDGTLADHASPELRRLRTEVANLRARIVGRLEELLLKHADILQDRFYTLREGRYVVPVRRDAHERFSGIVHGTSASGASIFVEPRGLVAQGNRLKMAQGELEREEARILAELSELVKERLPELHAATDALDHADLRQASARLGVDLGAEVLPLAEGPLIELRAGRHPLLLLDGVDVVASDLHLEAGQGLVISGPNAGGKTVALKLLGLAALMQRAGLPVPAEEGSRCGFFAPVLTDVGDEQSIAKNLSTFSAHVTNLASILERSGEGAMVLLDELAGGTDPEEGAALAQALVDAFCRRGVALATTTHYEPLKAFAARDDRLRNASVGFDVDAMLPTFALHWDVPGASSALSVAARFGIPARVIQTAREMLPEHTRTFDELVRGLEAQRQKLSLAQAGVESERAAAKAAREEIEERLEAMRARGRKAVDDEAKRLRDQLREARNELKALRKRLKQEADAEALAAAKDRIDRAAELAERTAPALGPMVEAGEVLSQVAVGDRVFVPRLRTQAEVLEEGARGQVRVAAGALKLWVDREELRSVSERALTPAEKAALRAQRRPGSVATPPSPRPPAPETKDRPQHPGNTLDVRGLRVDDALAMTESFLDRLFGASEGTGYILHGMGSGALREAVRAHLAADTRYVARHRGGTTEEGGERLTVVTLR